MRGKRSKQYRKLMQQFSLTFGFRPPYQVLVDAQMIQDSEAFKMNLVGGFERTLGDEVKPMITQCSIRHLYLLKDLPQDRKDLLISTAKDMERRRCNHHTLDQPLSTLECLSSVIDPKSSKSNPHHYVVASQDEDLRSLCRGVRGVPLIYIKRSVMVMEKMGEKSLAVREGVEKSKFRSGLRARGIGPLGKRKRGDEASEGIAGNAQEATHNPGDGAALATTKKAKGPKGPNPLAVKKSRKGVTDPDEQNSNDHHPTETSDGLEGNEARAGNAHVIGEPSMEAHDPASKTKRKRKHRSKIPQDLAVIDTRNEADE